MILQSRVRCRKYWQKQNRPLLKKLEVEWTRIAVRLSYATILKLYDINKLHAD